MNIEVNYANLKRRNTRIILITASIVFILMAIPGVFIAMMSVMMYDSPDASSYMMVNLLFGFIATFPIISVLSLLSWVFFYTKKYSLATFIGLLPLVNIFGVLILVAFSFMCNGRFDCF